MDMNTLEKKLNERESKGRKTRSAKKGMDLLFSKKPKALVTADEEIKKEDPVEKTPDVRVEEKIAVEPVKVQVEKTSKKIIRKKSRAKGNNVKKEQSLDLSDALDIPSSRFVKVPNKFIEALVMSNMSANEIKLALLIFKESLGWNKKFCELSKNDILTMTSITNNRLYIARDNLAESGVISFGKSTSGSKKTYYFIRKSFFMDDEDYARELLGDVNVSKTEGKKLQSIEEYLEKKKLLPKVYEAEMEKAQELVAFGKSEKDVLILAKFLDENGMNDGSDCIRPFAFLASGAYESVSSRLEGRAGHSSINQKLIYEVATSYNAREPLPEDIKAKLTNEDLAWISDRGGRVTLAESPTLKKDLGLS